PSAVRLNPRNTDFYSWRVVQGKEEVFSKIFARNLSDHSIGIFRLLCNEVGKSFEVVLSCAQGSTSNCIMSAQKIEPSFSDIIGQLQEENKRLSQQIQQATNKANTEYSRRQIAEEENHRLRSNQLWLEKQVRERAHAVEFFQGIVRCG
ncbi:hypothetical protein F5883DRAFT_421083, partial [Diaporthe sp. PMI_573]